ncbi:MAG: invasion associated locus B family protein [Methylovirgula sp.]
MTAAGVRVFVSLRSQGAAFTPAGDAVRVRLADHRKGFLMAFSLKRLGFVGLTGLLVLASGHVLTDGQALAESRKPAKTAQPAPQPAPAPAGQPGPIRVDLMPTQSDWTKVCGHDQAANKDICYTTRDFSAQADKPPVLAVAIYEIKGDDTRIVRLLMPVGLMLRPGFRFAVDRGPTFDGAFEICFPNGCFAESRVKSQTVDQMKKGTVLSIAVRNQVNNEVMFGVPLAGFGKAYDGPAVDPKVLAEQQKKLQEQLQKRAEEEKKRLEAARQAGAAAGGAAPPAAPGGQK